MTMNKKKVIFVTEKLIMGGVEKSLLEWIKILAPYMEITVAVMHLGGELETEIGKHATIRLLSDEKFHFRKIVERKIKISSGVNPKKYLNDIS